MHWIIIIVVAIALYLLYLYVVFLVSSVIFPIGCIVLTGAVLYNYLATMWKEMIMGQGWADSPVAPEPAFRQYYFRKAFHDYRQVVEESWKPNRALADWVLDKGKKLFTNGAVIFTWPLGITFFAIAGVGAIAAGIAYVIFGLIHLLLVVTCAVVAISLAFVVRLIEYLSMLWRRIFLVCPHANCYRPIPLPVYACPNCGATHNRLLPGAYGIFKRKCKCGALLPTLFLFGRNNLPGFCPHPDCQRPLNSSVGMTRNLHVPIVGGPATGKTSFLMASMCELYDRSQKGHFRFEFPEKKHETLFQRCSRDFLQGALVTKTAEESPDAFLVNLQDGGGGKALLYMYDAAGELYQRNDVLARHEYYSYTHGILFLLDPFSLPQVRVDYESSLKRASDQIKPCDESPQDVYDRMIGTLRAFSNTGGRFGSVPFAVVVTKSDAFGLARTIEAGGLNVPKGNSKNEDPESASVRQWLFNNGEGNLVRCIENDFKKVRYFHCSSLGRLPDSSSSPFEPQGVLDSLGWILTPYNVRFDRSSNGLAGAASNSNQIPYTVKIGGRDYNGAVVSSLWLVATLILVIFGGQWAITDASWGWPSYASTPTRPAYVPAPRPIVGRTGTTTTDVNLRSGPNRTTTRVGLAERGSRIRVLSIVNEGGWYEVEVTQHGRPKVDRSSDRGWLHSDYLRLE